MRALLHHSLLCIALSFTPLLQAQTIADPAVEAEATAATQETTPVTEAVGAAPSAEEAAEAETENSIAPPPADKGQVVFFRDKKFVGGGVNYKVREGESELGKLSNGSFFVHVTEPGAHEYTVHSEAKDILNMEIEAGETYYVIGGVTMGILAGRPNLSPSDQASFDALAGKLKPAKPIKKK